MEDKEGWGEELGVIFLQDWGYKKKRGGPVKAEDMLDSMNSKLSCAL